MTNEFFVERLRDAVFSAAVEATMETLKEPSGRQPHKELISLSKWFAELSAEDQKCIRSVAAYAARAAVFGMLAILDNVRRFSTDGEPGSLELRFVGPDYESVLNPADDEPLHDIFAALVPPPFG